MKSMVGARFVSAGMGGFAIMTVFSEQKRLCKSTYSYQDVCPIVRLHITPPVAAISGRTC